MAKYTVRRRYRRRPNRSNYRSSPYARSRYGSRKTFYRRRYPVRRRALAGVQNLVKFTAKRYDTYLAPWATGQETTTTNDYQTWQKTLNVFNFITGNQQFYRNLTEYHFIKINYLAFKVHEVSYNGYTATQLVVPPAGGDPYPSVSGITSLQMNNHPTYFVWDLEEDMSFDASDRNQVNPNQLTQYQYTKSLRPTSKKPISFVYKVPAPWRQFYSTYNFNATDKNATFGTFMENLTGIKNLRAPKHIMATHVNWWRASLPVLLATNQAMGYTQFAITLYMGVTFRGRAIMGSGQACEATDIPLTEQERELEQELEVELNQELEHFEPDTVSG